MHTCTEHLKNHPFIHLYKARYDGTVIQHDGRNVSVAKDSAIGENMVDVSVVNQCHPIHLK